MKRDWISLVFVFSLCLGNDLALAMPGGTSDPALFDRATLCALRAQLNELGVNFHEPIVRPAAYRRSLSAPALDLIEEGEESAPVRPRKKRGTHQVHTEEAEPTVENTIPAEEMIAETFAEDAMLSVRRPKLRRGLSLHFTSTDSDDLFEVTTALLASQIDNPLDTFLRESNDAKSRFFRILREQRFLAHRLGFLTVHARFDKIILDAFIKAMSAPDAQQASAQMAREIVARLQKLKINEDTRTAFRRLLKLARQKVAESEMELSAGEAKEFAHRILVNAFCLYFVGPIALESGDMTRVETMRGIMASVALNPVVGTEPGFEDLDHWNAWREVIDRLLSH